MNLSRFFFSLALAGSVLGTTSLAAADALPPEAAACGATSKAGDACSYADYSGSGQLTGTCKASKCTKLDYSSWDRDASSSPPSVQYDCLVCDGAAPAAEKAADGSTTAPAQNGQPSASSASSDDGGGCSVGGGAAKQAAPWLVAFAAAAVVTAVGRRRKRS